MIHRMVINSDFLFYLTDAMQRFMQFDYVNDENVCFNLTADEDNVVSTCCYPHQNGNIPNINLVQLGTHVLNIQINANIQTRISAKNGF